MLRYVRTPMRRANPPNGLEETSMMWRHCMFSVIVERWIEGCSSCDRSLCVGVLLFCVRVCPCIVCQALVHWPSACTVIAGWHSHSDCCPAFSLQQTRLGYVHGDEAELFSADVTQVFLGRRVSDCKCCAVRLPLHRAVLRVMLRTHCTRQTHPNSGVRYLHASQIQRG